MPRTSNPLLNVNVNKSIGSFVLIKSHITDERSVNGGFYL